MSAACSLYLVLYYSQLLRIRLVLSSRRLQQQCSLLPLAILHPDFDRDLRLGLLQPITSLFNRLGLLGDRVAYGPNRTAPN